ncbi:MAG: hypothetical protein M3Y77_12410 [Actinomycetota bacterium]|nr:hypothetical protein [Actinomycetota bacterium]MDQ2847124.1 hypothetical protein [Actinomycetota bacterium]MDQ2955706.1 hypothetical protein [Actinomycetota bacterium]
MTSSLDYARAVADAVLYEGYLLYPYRASSSKNQSRWQFGVLGPVGAMQASQGEDPSLASEFLLRLTDLDQATVTVDLRFLHLQKRSAQRAEEAGEFAEVAELVVGEQRWLSWDEATARELTLGPWSLAQLIGGHREQLEVPAGEEIESVGPAARLVRSRRALHGELSVRATVVGGLVRLSIRISNTATGAAADHDAAIAASFIGTHLLVTVENAEALSMTDPPEDAVTAAAGCAQHRCWPVLAGPAGDSSLMLVSPIILYDHPEIAAQSTGALFDSTEIDEILTLRVMTLTDEEKAAARATDPRAAEIIDRCDAMTSDELAQLHGILRDPHADPYPKAADQVDLTSSFGFDGEVPWWDPAVDGSVSPETDEVLIDGVVVSAGSVVRVHPSRRADAQDIFFADQLAKVAAVHSDVDGQTHVAVILLDDPAADLHEWYGRYLYFAPEELEVVQANPPAPSDNREESRP